MHITAECPRCHTRYQLDPTLRGQKMRCPQAQCRQVFEVTDSDTAFNRGEVVIASGKINQTGSVSDLVPLLPAEQAAEEAKAPPPAPKPPVGEPARGPSHVADFLPLVQAEAAAAPPARQEPPPVRDRGTASPRVPPPQEADWRSALPGSTPPAKQVPPVPDGGGKGPVELPPGAWEAPPVRRGRDGQGGTAAAAGDHEAEAEAARKAKGRHATRLMVGIVAGAVVILGGAGLYAWYAISQGEDHQYARAMKDYDADGFVPAAERFRKLAAKFPESSRNGEYRFLADLAELRAAVADEQFDTAKALARIDQFLKDNDSRPEDKALLEGRGRDLGITFVKRAESFLEQNATNAAPDQGPALDLVERLLGRLRQRLPQAVEKKESESIAGKIQGCRERIELARRRKEALDDLRRMVAEASAENINKVKAFLKSKALEVPGFDTDPEAVAILREIVEAHRRNVKYVTAANVPRSAADRGEDNQPGILFDHRVSGRPQPMEADQIVLALADGVLYALAASDGRTLWAMRVGIDTGQLPVRLPPTGAHPRGRLLVLSADTRTLFALDLDGNQLWKYQLDAAALGRPVLLTRRGGTVAYLPTDKGTVHEIGLAEGKLLGRFRLGQPLSAGGVHQKGTDLVYFPADDSCVYVLNVATKKCVAILYTNHAAGSLRGEPLIVGGDEERAGKTPAYLLLSLAGDLDTTVLRLFELPATGGDSHAVAMKNQPRIRGWTWATPYQDGEKLVCLSDAARLGLFGIVQPGNRDAPLFPLVPAAEEGHAGLDLTELLGKPEDVRRGRSLVAHVQGEELWVLAHGRLQRLALSLNNIQGPKPVPLWKQPLDLGSPLHAAQVREGLAGRTTLYLVTRPLKQPVCLVTAIDPEASDEATGADDRRILWQRQLGVVCQGQPLVAGGEVLTTGQAGGLFRFDPRRFKPEAEGQWQVGGQSLAAGLDQDAAVAPLLLHGEGQTVYQILCREGGRRLVVRSYEAPAGDVTEQEVELPGRLAGEVALKGQWLLAPLNDGYWALYRLPLGKKAVPPRRATWRSRRVGPEARCFIAVGTDEFLTTDGSRGVTHWRLYKGTEGQPLHEATKPKDRKELPTVELPDRVVTAPLLLPRPARGPLRVLVADARGVVTLLQGNTLEPGRTWQLGGTVTAGPFLRGRHVGCIVEHTRLVWLDPDKDGKQWEYKTSGGAIVDRPVQADGVLVVCDEGGSFVGLNPETGGRLGAGYTLKAAVAPAAAPVPFGKGRAFAPLTDGTILLLSLDLLRAPWWWQPGYAR